MKKEIHPEYKVATVKCVCGNEFQTRSTLDEISVEICSACHPFFTGQQKLVDSAGRVERFMKKYGDEYAASPGTGARPAKAPAEPAEGDEAPEAASDEKTPADAPAVSESETPVQTEDKPAE